MTLAIACTGLAERDAAAADNLQFLINNFTVVVEKSTTPGETFAFGQSELGTLPSFPNYRGLSGGRPPCFGRSG